MTCIYNPLVAISRYISYSRKYSCKLITFFIIHPANHLYTYFRNLWKFRTLHTNILQYLDHTLPDADTSILIKSKSNYLVAVYTAHNKVNEHNKFFNIHQSHNEHNVLYTDPPNDSAAKLFIKQITLLDLLLTRGFYSNELLVFLFLKMLRALN